MKGEIMKKIMGATVVVVGLGLSVYVWAHDEKDMKMPPQRASSPEFQQVKQLTGNWKGTATHPGTTQKAEPVAVEFEVTAAGSDIEETLMKDTPHEMVDMYADESGKLAMTHY